MISPGNLIFLILGWVIGSAIFAIPASIASVLLKTNLSGFAWAFIATLLAFIYSIALGYLVDNLYFAIPLLLAGNILIYSLALQTSIPKAALVCFAQFASVSVIFLVGALLLGGEFGFVAFGHKVWLYPSFGYEVQNGQGTKILRDGARYVGDLRGGRPNGQGTYTRSDGTKYVGAFKDGEPNGQGTLVDSRGAEFAGRFEYGRLNGQGTCSFPDGGKYVGEFKNGWQDGHGTFTRPNGMAVSGEFRDGKPYRTTGTDIGPDGTREVGTWNYDGTISGGTITWKDGRQYEGDWKVVEDSTDLPDGHGKMTYPDGHVEAGLWKEGKFIGASTKP